MTIDRPPGLSDDRRTKSDPPWAHFGFAQTSLPGRLTDSLTRPGLRFIACKRVSTASSGTSPSVRQSPQLQSNCSRVSMPDIGVDHIEVAASRVLAIEADHSEADHSEAARLECSLSRLIIVRPRVSSARYQG
jgi:hypothetical protein